MKTKINLDEIREAITSVKRKNGCGAAEVAAEEVRAELGSKGSHSTSGPLIRSMLDEAILAEHLKYENVSSRLKAAFLSELRRVAGDSTTELRRQLAESARLNDDLRNKHSEISMELAEIKLKSARGQAAASEKATVLETSLAEAKGIISTFDEVKKGLSSQLDDTKSDLAEKRKEIDTFKNDLVCARAREEKKEQQLEELSAKLRKAEVDYQASGKERDLAESRVGLLEERISDLKTENTRLVGQVDRLTAEIEGLHGDLLTTAQKRASAEARLEELLKKDKAGRSTRGRENGANKGADKANTDT